MTSQSLALRNPRPSNLRAFDMRRDLLAVADLVELCFKDSLDADGRLYIRQMRRTAESHRLLNIATAAAGTEMPPGGFVWVEADALVGNLSLIPVIAFGKRRYLIANVAVHPDFRRRGIASQMTLAAIKRARQQGADEIWLQVDADNAAAQNLYQQMGFAERARRLTWQGKPQPELAATLPIQAPVRNSSVEDWDKQIAWLKATYPPKLQWNLPLDFKLFQPGWRGSMQRFFGDRRIQQWSAVAEGELLGVLTWQSSTLQADRLWLAAEKETEAMALQALLAHAHLHLRVGRALLLNYPEGRAEKVFEALGFSRSRHLIWMQYRKAG